MNFASEFAACTKLTYYSKALEYLGKGRLTVGPLVMGRCSNVLVEHAAGGDGSTNGGSLCYPSTARRQPCLVICMQLLICMVF